jgi:hypothetical protein
MVKPIDKRLLTIAKKLNDIAKDIQEIANDLEEPKQDQLPRSRAKDITINDALVERLQALGRDDAQKELSGLTHKQLGSIIRELGGSSEEAKKTKAMIIERILYRLFDYSTGHKLLKGDGKE